MIIKPLKGEFLQKQFGKKLTFVNNVFFISLLRN